MCKCPHTPGPLLLCVMARDEQRININRSAPLLTCFFVFLFVCCCFYFIFYIFFFVGPVQSIPAAGLVTVSYSSGCRLLL